ncbi:hypothetical protein [Nocardia sp. NPDC056100]|uniref:hypothetical protein n=1 Tax=Nocardia sp. NPDC056100 TaxID=3345712 RepID=UPI0035DDF790
MTTTETETVHYTMIEPTPDGGSRFTEGQLPLSVRPVADGVDHMATGELATAGVLFVRSGGFDSTPHPAPAQQWVVMIRGTIEVTVTSGHKRVFGPGDLLLAADVEGRGHSTVTVGSPPFEALFIPADA